MIEVSLKNGWEYAMKELIKVAEDLQAQIDELKAAEEEPPVEGE